MSEKLSRRDFLKLAGAGTAVTTVLTGCGPASRYVTREPYMKMPEYTYNGLSTYYATTCRECAAGCGIVVRTMQGRALKVEGNANHPVNLGKTCARGQATLHGLYNPNRVRGPIKHARGERLYDTAADPFIDDFNDMGANMNWDEAIQVVSDALTKYKPEEIAFLTGTSADHLFDLASEVTKAIGAPAPVRYGALGMFEARATLTQASEEMLGAKGLPFFDIEHADFVLSFGANFLETWLSPVAYTRGFSRLRKGNPQKRGYFVHVEARMSSTAAKADMWLAAKPGTEGLVALAIGKLVAEIKHVSMPKAFAAVDPHKVAKTADLTIEQLEAVAQKFAEYSTPIVVPGGAALGLSNGLATAEAILALNALADNFGKAGGVFISPLAPAQDEYHRPANFKEMTAFVETLKSGKVKVLFVHGVNPLFELPASLGFADALANVEQVISFATFPDETATQADYIFPDHHSLESWGYQRVATGAAQATLSGAQPVVVPFYDTRSTLDLILASAQKAGGKLTTALPYKDEVDFLRSKLSSLTNQAGGFFSAPEIDTFMAYFQQNGGWWKTANNLVAPSSADALNKSIKVEESTFAGEGEFFLLPFVSTTLAEAGANKPWLQELPDPTTTVMWNTWVEMNPETGHELHIDNDDVIRITSEAGVLEAPVYLYPAIRPDVIAIPFGQGHTAYGRYAEGRGVNPLNLMGETANESGDLAFAGMKVKIEKTGKKQPLSRLEGIMGVYGIGLGGEEH